MISRVINFLLKLRNFKYGKTMLQNQRKKEIRKNKPSDTKEKIRISLQEWLKFIQVTV
jgi:hypothetical protein